MTGWPPLTRSGLAKLGVTTSTDMPGSMRMPLNCVRDLVVIKNLGICLLVFVVLLKMLAVNIIKTCRSCNDSRQEIAC